VTCLSSPDRRSTAAISRPFVVLVVIVVVIAAMLDYDNGNDNDNDNDQNADGTEMSALPH